MAKTNCIFLTAMGVNFATEVEELVDAEAHVRDAKPYPAGFRAAALPWPATTIAPVELQWRYVIGIPLIHVLALLAFVPWLFSWTGVVCALAGHFVFGVLGINLGYHRLLTHRSFAAPKWLERSLAILGVCTLQDTPACWVAMHRLHHKHADERPDPHSPLVNFLWSHCGWLMVKNRDFLDIRYYEFYARDILGDAFYRRLERSGTWVMVYLANTTAFFIAGFALGWLLGGSTMAAVQFGLSLLVWGVFVRTVLTWHITWSVNSVTHLWGYQNYDTRDSSRNNFLVGLWASGEGWHNNHHADQRAAMHGHKWWEFDITWIVIRALEKVGLASQIVPPRHLIKRGTID
jgi:stearoyl-CoA desaturase (delta-9 desaturase)